MMREEAAERSGMHIVLEHTTVLAASCDEVWAVLADLSGWVDWNVVHPDPSRPMVAGGRTRLRLALRPGRVVTVPVRWEEVSPGRALSWSGGPHRLLHAHHGFELTPAGTGCRLRHHETFSGALSGPLLRVAEATLLARYREVNGALARRVGG